MLQANRPGALDVQTIFGDLSTWTSIQREGFLRNMRVCVHMYVSAFHIIWLVYKLDDNISANPSIKNTKSQIVKLRRGRQVLQTKARKQYIK